MILKSDELEDAVAAEEAREEEGPDSAGSGTPPEAGAPPKQARSRLGEQPVTLRTVGIVVLIACLVAAVGVLGWQVRAKANELDDLRASAAVREQVEQVALDYATGAAEMNFRDLAAWHGRLTKGTTPELSDRLTRAASSMEQIIMPLQWTSTARPIAAKILSESNGIYSVSCFVSVLTKNSQAPDGIQSTATYQLSIDSENNSVITEIGGIGSALPTAPVNEPPAPPSGAVPAPGLAPPGG
ncbi:hypothetical protein [Nocardia jinanensis]|uniref:Mce-associated membrane protein n=1 Tax=Nocardia jinanensis TaxID=382504 RepID=A0A917RJ40_9NOCA|nr:hypothetical protein [Nocardia jinanensis]GGL10199.1 hypothetical protein GCM10011588_25820 [Nocardia jinanensis]